MRENNDYHPKMLNSCNFPKGDPNSEVLNSSPSIVSELPDIKNWFSSYTYQSPVLDTNEIFGITFEVDDGELDLYVEDSEIEDEENWEDLTRVRKSIQHGVCERTTRPIIHGSGKGPWNHDANPSHVEVPVDPDSLSLPSEPPDIKEWFSSYAYESPTLGSTDFDVSVLSNNDFRTVEEFDKASVQPIRIDCSKTRQEKEESENTDSDEEAEEAALQSTDIINDKLDDFRREKAELPTTFHDLNPTSTSNEDTIFSDKRKVKAENEDNEWSENIDSDIIPDKKLDEFLRENAECTFPTTFQDPNRTRTSNEDTIFSEKRKVVAENELGWILPTNKSRKTLSESRKIDNLPFLGKENEAYPLSKKKNTINPIKNDENSVRNLKREALRDTTNKLYIHSFTTDVPGKWKCPQKRKPNLGPPLKQLRLERWVCRK